MSEPFPGGPDPAEEPARAAAGSAGAQAPASYGYGSDLTGGHEIHLLDYVKVLHKRRRTVLTAFLIVVGSVCVYTFTATPVYEARVQLLIEKENASVVSFKEVFQQNQVADDYFQTQYKILQS